MTAPGNIDQATVAGFGDEWAAFDQTAMTYNEWHLHFSGYFSIFPFDDLPPNAEGFDLGCGSGRWAAGMVERVGTLHCIDPAAKALDVARARLAHHSNVRFHLADAGSIPLPDASQDFGYSLGVLHHVPDTLAALENCTAKLKPGAPFLLYIYYALDQRPAWFRALWRVTDMARRGVSRLPFTLRKACTTLIAAGVYWPLANIARISERLGADVANFPLSSYRYYSFLTMRTDALDRFGTRLEHRFTKEQIQALMETAGLSDIRFRDDVPYWIACGRKRTA